MVTRQLIVIHVAECAGGVDRYLRCLMKYSDREKVENILILSNSYCVEPYLDWVDKIETMQISHSIGLNSIKSAWILRRRIEKYRPDIVVAHSSIAGAVTRMACVGLKCKVVYNPHGWSFNMESKKKNIFVLLERFMAMFCDSIICISDAEKQSALKNKICKEEKLSVIYNGIDLREYKKKSCQLAIPSDIYVVGMVGRICRQKAPDIFVKMAGELKKQIDNVKFVIVGDVIESDVDEKEKIKEMAEELGIDLLITGWVDNPLDYMDRFDVGCLFSRWEGFGLAIPEYMVAGVPIVASNVDAIPYLIEDGVNGVLVEKDDWKNAAKKVQELLINTHKRKLLIENGRKTVAERFDVQRVAKEYEKLYGELCK